ncbi:PEP-CTERM sorting domain-containing protein [Thalassotalea sp. Y01]|uniref:PEP-CTERM sorting domain-containing protein n=1 Tax=Thalassotalea sp. Y01 TaxID=2729613 RepID=UPI00145D0CA1|nr:PEP-CTERM sorting domain-containing protein [Thalassotalea sp. Y01]NMP14861.1 PEP-CTERM sorting domain-containing protein [Thalassotalea sp. Y01]
MYKGKNLIGAILLLMLSSFATKASYMEPCDEMYIGVEQSYACDMGTINNDKLNPIQVNVDMMFGYDDWEFLSKDESSTGQGQSGTFTFDPMDGYDIMVVLKGGAAANPDVYVGYWLDFESAYDAESDSYIFTWDSPFVGPNGPIQDVSHVSFYARLCDEASTTDGLPSNCDGTNPPSEVPEPTSLLILASGLLGLRFARKRV